MAFQSFFMSASTEGYFFSADDADVGCDEATPVTPDYKNGESSTSCNASPSRARETEGRHEPARMRNGTFPSWA